MSAIPSSPHHLERISSRLPPNVWVLGAAAFFNDTATEMSYWLLPQFLVGVLGAGPLVFGLIEGAAQTIASVGRLLSGVISDRLRRRKPLAALGYTVESLAKPLLAVAQSWGQVFWIRFADRAAKGFRAAPRDALIADSVPPEKRGAAFGLRQAMDSAGAIAGPSCAILLLSLLQGKVRLVFLGRGGSGAGKRPAGLAGRARSSARPTGRGKRIGGRGLLGNGSRAFLYSVGSGCFFPGRAGFRTVFHAAPS